MIPLLDDLILDLDLQFKLRFLGYFLLVHSYLYFLKDLHVMTCGMDTLLDDLWEGFSLETFLISTQYKFSILTRLLRFLALDFF
mgnify:CR=1 FL=1